MTCLNKSALSLAALVLASGALTLVAPPGAHAIAAALVQVTNTASNPAITQDTGRQAAQLVDVSCVQIGPGASTGCVSVSPKGSYPGEYYSVPANQTLVVTGVDIQPDATSPSQCAAISIVEVSTNNASRKGWQVSGVSTLHYAYPSGFLLGPGQAIGLQVIEGSACAEGMELHGYLTTN